MKGRQLTGKLQSACGIWLLLFAFILQVAPAVAGWREDMGLLKIGFVGGERTSLAIRRIEPFRKALEDELGIRVTVFAAKGYAALIRAQTSARIDYSVFSASSYASAWIKCRCIEPLAAANLAENAPGIYSILVVKRDNFSELQELQGKSLATSNLKSLTGYILPVVQLKTKGLRLAEGPAKDGSTELIVAGSAIASQKLFLSGIADGLLGWSTMSGVVSNGYSAGTLRDLQNQSGSDSAEFRILWQSGRITNGPHAVRKEMPEQAKTIIRQFLLKLFDKNPEAYDAVEPYRSGGFASVKPADYDFIIQFLSQNENDGASQNKQKPAQ